MSLNEQHRHPFGNDRNEVVCEFVSGSDSVKDLADEVNHRLGSIIRPAFDAPSISVVSPKSALSATG